MNDADLLIRTATALEQTVRLAEYQLAHDQPTEARHTITLLVAETRLLQVLLKYKDQHDDAAYNLEPQQLQDVLPVPPPVQPG
jgi:hypothetical protein